MCTTLFCPLIVPFSHTPSLIRIQSPPCTTFGSPPSPKFKGGQCSACDVSHGGSSIFDDSWGRLVFSATLLFSGMVAAGLWQVQTMYQRQVLHFSKDENVRLTQIGSVGGIFVNLIVTPLMLAKAGEKKTLLLGLSVYSIYLASYGVHS